MTSFLLAFLCTFLCALAMTRADLGFRQHGTGLEQTRSAHTRDRLDAVPDADADHLPHDAAYLVELGDELLVLVRFRAAAGGDAAPAADVNHVGIAPFLLGHRIDHALDAFESDFRIFAIRNHVAHAGHLAN